MPQKYRSPAAASGQGASNFGQTSKLTAVNKKQEMNLKKLRILALPLTSIALVALALADTAPYRAARKEADQKMTASALAKVIKDTEADVQSLIACKSTTLYLENHSTKGLSQTPERRSCLLAAIPDVKTAQGALVASMTATAWLTNQPDDDGIKKAALAAIARGRTALLANKAMSDTVDKVAEAHDRSITMRVLNGQYGSSGEFWTLAKQLDQAEFGVLLPEVKLRQDQWRIDAPAT